MQSSISIATPLPAERPRLRERLAAVLPQIVLAPSIVGDLRLRLRLLGLDVLHLAVQFDAAAELRLRRLRALCRAVEERPLDDRLHQPLPLRLALRGRGDRHRADARGPHRPAGQAARPSGGRSISIRSPSRSSSPARSGAGCSIRPPASRRSSAASAGPISSSIGSSTATMRSTPSSSPASGRRRDSRWRCSSPACAPSTTT